MFYELRNVNGVVIDQHKDHDLEELSFCDDANYDDKRVFSFRGKYDNLESFFDFNIDLKDAIRLRNALNSFIEIQKIK
jgi:hypothetical protein